MNINQPNWWVKSRLICVPIKKKKTVYLKEILKEDVDIEEIIILLGLLDY